MLSRQTRAVELEIRKLDERIRETKGAAQLARSKTGIASTELVRLIETHFPYDLKNVEADARVAARDSPTPPSL